MTRLERLWRIVGLTLSLTLLTALAAVLPPTRAEIINRQYCLSHYGDYKPLIPRPPLEMPSPQGYKWIERFDDRAESMHLLISYAQLLKQTRHDPRIEPLNEAANFYILKDAFTDFPYEDYPGSVIWDDFCFMDWPV